MIDPERPEDVGPVLLAQLHGKLGPAVELAEGPVRLFGGNQTFVHAFRLAGAPPPWDGPLVLRVLRAHRSADEVVFESSVQNALAPLAPRVLLHERDATAFGAAFQIMERVAGRALLLGDVGQDVQHVGVLRQLLVGFRDTAFGPWPDVLADVHTRLHALPTEELVRSLEAEGLGDWLRLERRVEQLEQGVEELGLDGMRPAVSWLRERVGDLSDRTSLCHGDLFPNQVYVEDGAAPRVIDWADASLAPGGFDVSLVCAGIETLPIPGMAALQRRLVRRFHEACASRRPLDPDALRFGAVFRPVATLLAMGRYRAGQGPKPVPYEPKGERRLLAHLARSGIEVRF